jgi:cell division septum initiation protein DivIVA
MATSDEASTPEDPERSILSLLRESGDALEAASPPFDAAAAASRLGQAARAQGLLRLGGVPGDSLAATGAELEEEAPPFDVETGAARLREAASARGLLSSDTSEDSAEQAYQAELDRLTQENEELRAKLAEALRGGKSAVPAMMGRMLDSMDTAERVRSLALQTADQAISDARRESDETLARARREVDEMITKARRQAEQIIDDGRARAESLERDAQERHRQAMGSLVPTREELERRVDDLRAFEHEYRSRLKAYLEGQLRDLEAGVTGSGITSAPPQSATDDYGYGDPGYSNPIPGSRAADPRLRRYNGPLDSESWYQELHRSAPAYPERSSGPQAPGGYGYGAPGTACVNCESPLDIDDAYCGNCGQAVTAAG